MLEGMMDYRLLGCCDIQLIFQMNALFCIAKTLRCFKNLYDSPSHIKYPCSFIKNLLKQIISFILLTKFPRPSFYPSKPIIIHSRSTLVISHSKIFVTQTNTPLYPSLATLLNLKHKHIKTNTSNTPMIPK